LPTEAEWEHAARAGTSDAFYTGPITNADETTCGSDPNLDPAGWYCFNSIGAPHAVGGKQANAWGLKDMLGNVWEWCFDLHGPYRDTVTDYTGPETGTQRIFRGGSWINKAAVLRAAQRYNRTHGYRDYNVGFRATRSVVP
jgi:formylglycine-generating enzyme required for sulfatase activity